MVATDRGVSTHPGQVDRLLVMTGPLPRQPFQKAGLYWRIHDACAQARNRDGVIRPRECARRRSPGNNSGGFTVNFRCEARRSEEHKSELQSLMRTSYAVLCHQTKNNNKTNDYINQLIDKDKWE